MPLPEIADRPEIWLIVGRKDAEGYVLLQPAFDLARGVDAVAVGVQQHLDHHPRMVRWVTSQLSLVCPFDLA